MQASLCVPQHLEQISEEEKKVVVSNADVSCAVYQLLPLPMQSARSVPRLPRLPPTGQSKVWKVSVVSVGSRSGQVTSGHVTDCAWLQAQDDTVSVDAQTSALLTLGVLIGAELDNQNSHQHRIWIDPNFTLALPFEEEDAAECHKAVVAILNRLAASAGQLTPSQ